MLRTSVSRLRLAAVAAVGLAAATLSHATADIPSGNAPQIHVSGNQLVDEAGHPVILRGVSRSGSEFVCHNKVFGTKVFDGPTDVSSARAIKSWHVNVVRIPLNEDCWLGLPGATPGVAGAPYRRAIAQFVRVLHSQGLMVILDLHWSRGVDLTASASCRDESANCQKAMPDAAHAPAFWRSVASAYKSDRATLFDLFNEPFPTSTPLVPADPAWDCWQKGGGSCSLNYPAVGMQGLVDAVRSTGARNVVLLGGLSYSNDLSGWLAHEPTDPTGNLAASWHSYNFNLCNFEACWDTQILPVSLAVPVVTTEIGEDDCAHTYIDALMAWLDSHKIAYLAWTWNTWDCHKGPTLIIDDKGTPSPYGAGYRAHLAAVS